MELQCLENAVKTVYALQCNAIMQQITKIGEQQAHIDNALFAAVW